MDRKTLIDNRSLLSLFCGNTMCDGPDGTCSINVTNNLQVIPLSWLTDLASNRRQLKCGKLVTGFEQLNATNEY